MALSPKRQHGELDTVRDTVESLWVAIVVAFVLRAFLLEAFVIPTGSMAPRLLGEHWDLACPACGYEYSYGLTAQRNPPEAVPRGTPAGAAGSSCPNCGLAGSPVDFINGGDRVLVLKYLYNFRPPRPWDVIVFRNPQDNRQNYIKRLIGLPGETIEVVRGDVFVSSSPSVTPRIRRKPRVAQEAMWQMIFDNDYQPDPNRQSPDQHPQWRPDPPDRWTSLDGAGRPGTQDSRRFVFRGGKQPTDLVFRTPAAEPERRTFLPHYGYNSRFQEESHSRIDPDTDVCTDLKLQVVFLPTAGDALLGLETTSLEHRFRAEVSGDGTVRLLHRLEDDPPGRWETWGGPRKVPGVRVGRGCEVALAHADYRVRLLVDGEVVLESTDSQYDADYGTLKDRLLRGETAPTPRVKLTGQGGGFELRHLRLLRDVYYTPFRLDGPPSGPVGDYSRRLRELQHDRPPTDPAAPRPALEGQPGWGTMGNPIVLREFPENHDLDEFFVLGDNSPLSLDSRGWVSAAPTLRLYWDPGHTQPLYKFGTIPRYNLIGKAFFVYWPAGFRVPGLAGLPLIPNVGRMRLIR